MSSRHVALPSTAPGVREAESEGPARFGNLATSVQANDAVGHLILNETQLGARARRPILLPHRFFSQDSTNRGLSIEACGRRFIFHCQYQQSVTHVQATFPPPCEATAEWWDPFTGGIIASGKLHGRGSRFTALRVPIDFFTDS